MNCSLSGPRLSMTGHRPAGALEQWWDMGRATNLEEFEAELRRLQIPIFTVIYADRDGHILSLFGGQVPVRPAGVDDWSSPVAGDTSATIWTEIHPYEELPLVIDPPGGWVQNSNSAPWYTTYPLQLDPDAFPPIWPRVSSACGRYAEFECSPSTRRCRWSR